MSRPTLLLALALAFILTACDRKPAPPLTGPIGVTGIRPPPSPRMLRILLGSSMVKPLEEMKALYTQRTGIQIEMDQGGSETLYPKIETGTPSDIFVCHDPFEAKVKSIGKLAGAVVVGELRPVLIVKPGNPRGIRSIDDLAAPHDPELKIGNGRVPDSTCGTMFVAMLNRRGLVEAIAPKVKLEGRTHVEIANGVEVGPLDAGVVWNFIVPQYAGKVQAVPTADRYDPIRVTILGLSNSPDPAARDAFLDYCRSAEVATIFERHGYAPAAATQPASRGE